MAQVPLKKHIVFTAALLVSLQNEMPGETDKLYRNSEWQAQATGMKKELTSPINQEYGGVLHVACKIFVEVRTAKPTEKGCTSPTWNKTLKFVLCY